MSTFTTVSKSSSGSFSKINKTSNTWTGKNKSTNPTWTDQNKSSVISSYSEANFKFTLDDLSSVDAQRVGMNFKNVNDGTLDSCKFFMTKTGSPSGNVVAKLYAITGVFGVNSIPTGSALATSDTISVLTIPLATGENIYSDRSFITFNFTGANRYSLVANTNYVISVEYSGGGIGNYLQVSGGDSNLPVGTPVQDYGSGWGTYIGDAYIFYVSSVSSYTTKNKTSSSWTKINKS